MSEWLSQASLDYNLQSLNQRDSYAGVIFIPIKVLSQIIDWSFQSLPDEILVGLDIDTSKSLDRALVSKYTGSMFEPDLFAGQGMFVSKQRRSQGGSFLVKSSGLSPPKGVRIESIGRFTTLSSIVKNDGQ